nr:hypothetical protein [Burkholderiaceae bacterium]
MTTVALCVAGPLAYVLLEDGRCTRHQLFGPRSMAIGCQRRKPEFGRTVGLTHDIGQRPPST